MRIRRRRMSPAPITVAGIPIPSDSPAFLAVLAVHILAGVGSVTTGLIAMLSPKGPGRHSRFGTLYYRCLAVVFASMAILSAMRWLDDYHLFILGTLSFSAAFVARRAVRRRSDRWVRLHITGNGSLLCLAPHCVLRRQRQEPSPLERPPNAVVLVAPGSRRHTDHPASSVAPSPRPCRAPGGVREGAANRPPCVHRVGGNRAATCG